LQGLHQVKCMLRWNLLNCCLTEVKAQLFMIALLLCPEGIPLHLKCLGTIYMIVL
jgi:hypothetical protein